MHYFSSVNGHLRVGSAWRYKPVKQLVEEGALLSGSDDGENVDEKPVQMQSGPTPRRKTSFYAKVGIAGLILLAAIGAIWRIHHTKQPDFSFYENLETHVLSNTKTNDAPHLCGNSSAEALALGCEFDQLTWAWLPKHCPHYANDEFLHAEPGKPWKYYEDVHGKTAIDARTWQAVLDGELIIFGERREHLTHCVYLFLSLGQIIRDKTKYIPKLVEYEHIHHCSMLLLDVVRKERAWNDVQTVVGTVSFDQDCSD